MIILTADDDIGPAVRWREEAPSKKPRAVCASELSPIRPLPSHLEDDARAPVGVADSWIGEGEAWLYLHMSRASCRFP